MKVAQIYIDSLSASRVAWQLDGGRGFWGLYQDYFSHCAIGILDFYHAAQNLWKAAAAWLDGRLDLGPPVVRDWYGINCVMVNLTK